MNPSTERNSYAKRKAIRVANEIASRRIEALNLYVPQPTQDEFHRCNAPECMLMGGNRGGKSLAAFVECARAALGKDPHGKYPLRDGVLGIVGYKQWHIGNVIYPYLFKAGAFKIIRDAETKQFFSIDITGRIIRGAEDDPLQVDGLPIRLLIFNRSTHSVWGTPDSLYIESQYLEGNETRRDSRRQRRIALLKFLYDAERFKL